jgi:hypothetical protein
VAGHGQLFVTTTLSLISGWFSLQAKFPDQAVEPTLRLRGLSGLVGPGVSFRGNLNLAISPQGLRVGMSRLFAPFSRDFLAPWQEVSVSRKTVLLWQFAKIEFGKPPSDR